MSILFVTTAEQLRSLVQFWREKGGQLYQESRNLRTREPTIEVIDEEESDEDPELFEDNEDGQEVSDYQKQLEDNFGVEDEETFGLNQEEVEEVTGEEEENFSNSNSSPITGESLVAVEDLLGGSDED